MKLSGRTPSVGQGQEVEGHEDQDPRAHEQEDDGRRQAPAGMGERETEESLVAPFEPAHDAGSGRPGARLGGPARASSHGMRVREMTSDASSDSPNGQGEGHEKQSREASDEQERKEHRHGGHRARRVGGGYVQKTTADALPPLEPEFPAVVDAFKTVVPSSARRPTATERAPRVSRFRLWPVK